MTQYFLFWVNSHQPIDAFLYCDTIYCYTPSNSWC